MQTPFHDINAFLALPRCTGLQLSPDGSRLITSIATLNGKRTQYRSALWQIDPTGASPAQRLTRSRKGESSATFTDSGEVLFTSARPDPDADEDEEGPAALWLLPAHGGDARLVGNRLGGYEKVLSKGNVVVSAAQRLPSSADEATDDAVRKERKENTVTAVLHTSYPVRHWDHDTGPGAVHLLVADLPDEHDPAADPVRLQLRDLTPQAGPQRVQDFDVSPDGSFAVVCWAQLAEAGERRTILVRLDLTDGTTTTLVDEPGADAFTPLISPDGTRVLWTREDLATPEKSPHIELHVLDPTDGTSRRVAADWAHWTTGQAWLPDSSGLILAADSDGRGPLYLLDLITDTVTQLTSEDATFTDPQVSPDGRWVYALRTSYLAPSEAVRIDLDAARSAGMPVAAELLRTRLKRPRYREG